MDHWRYDTAIRLVDEYRRGIRTAEETCLASLSNLEPEFVQEYVALLLDELRSSLIEILPRMPVSDEDWIKNRAKFLDGDEWIGANLTAEYRAQTEAAREYLLGQSSPPAAPDFLDRVRAAYRESWSDWPLP
jgi:hypothetical protein